MQFFIAPDGSVQYRWAGCASCNTSSDTVAIPGAGTAGNRFVRVSATKASDGRLVVAASDTSNYAYVVEEVTSGGAWGAWTSAGCCVTDLAVVWVATGPWVFGKGLDSQVWDNARLSGTWQGWQRRAGGGNNIAYVSAVALPSGAAAVGVSTTDGSVWVNKQPAAGGPSVAFSGFALTSSCCVYDLALGATTDGTPYIAAIGYAYELWHIWQAPSGSWSAWNFIGSSNQRNVSVARFPDARLVIAAANTSGQRRRLRPRHRVPHRPRHGPSGRRAIRRTHRHRPVDIHRTRGRKAAGQRIA